MSQPQPQHQHPLRTSHVPFGDGTQEGTSTSGTTSWLLAFDNLPPPSAATPAATLAALTDAILLTAFLATPDSPDTPIRLYAANLHSTTLQPFLTTSSKSTQQYYTLLYNALTQVDFTTPTEHVQLTLHLDPLTNLVDLQWKTTPAGSAFSFVLGAVTLQPVTDPLRVMFAQQMYLARLADQQAQYLDVIAKHQAEVATVKHARQAALDELLAFAWATREREDAMLLKMQALLNEKKRKVKKVQAENRKLKQAAAGAGGGFVDHMDVDPPAATMMMQTTRTMSPTKTTAVASATPTSSSSSTAAAAGGGKKKKKPTKSKRKSSKFRSDSSDTDGPVAARPAGPVPPGLLPPGRLEFPVLPMQPTRMGPSRTLSGVEDPLPLRSTLGIGSTSAALLAQPDPRSAAAKPGGGGSSGSATESGSEFDLASPPRRSAGPSGAAVRGGAVASGSDTE